MSPEPDTLSGAIAACMLIDQPRLRRRLQRLARLAPGPERAQGLARLAADIEVSRSRRAQRSAPLPGLGFPAELPVCERRTEIAELIAGHQVVVLCGETGSGKSTQLPKICLELGLGSGGMIGHTQPRRIAARSLAARLAAETGTELGGAVGYKIRFSDRTRPDTRIKVMTDGMLLAEIQHNRSLLAYDALIIDEAHERSLNIDFLLGFLTQLLPRRPELKLIITSATIDPQRFARYFGGAPVLEVSGRTYPVEIRYRPLDEREREEGGLQQALLDAVDEVAARDAGDILIFLPGERDIREAIEGLRKHHPPHTEIVPLFARLGPAEQDKVFGPHGGRRIVVATNVAETSLTVPGIRYVIDSGLARISRYSPRAKVQRLPIEPVSRASADQRAGRCGRVAAGVCIRLYSEQDYLQRAPHTDPEILRTNLASVILQMRVLDLGDIEDFPFIDPPDTRAIGDGYQLLVELGAFDEQRGLTETGRRMARLALDPRIARMVLGAAAENCLAEVLVIAAALSVQDPRERPLDARQAADERHKAFQDPRSDFLAYLNLWRAFNEQARHLSQAKLRRYCSENFLSCRRLREWRDVHGQLHEGVCSMGFRLNEKPADYDAIHRALLTGLLGHVAQLGEQREYLGARGRKLVLFPGSALYARPAKWIMAAELVQTSRLYAHTAARIEPEWIERAGAHLLKRSHYEPHWDARSGRVMAYERATLYGLVVNARRRVPYAAIDPAETRRIFIQAALVEGGLRGGASFLGHNRSRIDAIRRLEDKTRRRDILADAESLHRFYDERVPANITDAPAFERWRRQIEREDPRRLFMDEETLMRRAAGEVSADQYPAAMTFQDVEFPLSYRFEPGHPDDGVTMTVPLAALNQVDAARCEWLVPGLLPEKIVALIKSLPKRLRRSFVPAADFAAACAQALRGGRGRLAAAVAAELQRMTGVTIPDDAWRSETLEPHLRMNFRVVDEDGATVASGRDLGQLQTELGARARGRFAAQVGGGAEREGITAWDFGELPEVRSVTRAGLTLKAYPALLDRGDSVALKLLDTAEEAAAGTRSGLRRLFLLALTDKRRYLQRTLPELKPMCLHYAPLGSCDELQEQLFGAAVDKVFIAGQALPRDAAAFARRLEEGRGRFVAAAAELCSLAADILSRYHDIARQLSRPLPPTWLESVADVRDQLARLVYPGFLLATPPQWLGHVPRYLEAVRLRLSKLSDQPDRDLRRLRELRPLWSACLQRLDRTADAETERLRWLMEELRVSVFAQELKTVERVSVPRLQRLLEDRSQD